MSKPKLSTHVLDTSVGKPAAGLYVELFKQRGEQWVLWHSTVTTSDGRAQFPFQDESLPAATYKLKFKVGDHYRARNVETFYPYVEIVFQVQEGQHYHVPLLFSPYGYSTYRGS